MFVSYIYLLLLPPETSEVEAVMTKKHKNAARRPLFPQSSVLKTTLLSGTVPRPDGSTAVMTVTGQLDTPVLAVSERSRVGETVKPLKAGSNKGKHSSKEKSVTKKSTPAVVEQRVKENTNAGDGSLCGKPFLEEGPRYDTVQLFCNACLSFLAVKKSSVDKHVKTTKHQDNFLRTKYQLKAMNACKELLRKYLTKISLQTKMLQE